MVKILLKKRWYVDDNGIKIRAKGPGFGLPHGN